MLNAKQFVHLLRNEFPGQIARRIKSEESIYFQMPYFAKFVKAAIDQGDFKRVERSFVFAERMLIEADDSLYNALCVSFIESIDFTTENGTSNP